MHQRVLALLVVAALLGSAVLLVVGCGQKKSPVESPGDEELPGGPTLADGAWEGSIDTPWGRGTLILVLGQGALVSSWSAGEHGTEFDGSYTVRGSTVMFTGINPVGRCPATWQGKATVTQNTLTGTLSGSHCTSPLTQAPFSLTRFQ